MKLRRQHVHGIAKAVISALQHNTNVEIKCAALALEEKIGAVLDADMAAERAIEDEAQKLLTQQLRKAGGVQVDESRAFQMIKKELAKKRGFIL